MSNLGTWLYLPLLFFIAGCATGDVQVTGQNFSLGEIKTVVVSVIGDPRSQSQNQRTYVSQYFGPKNDKKFDPKKSKRRKYAVITILGDRRPYDLAIDVHVEEKRGEQYVEVGLDTQKGEEISKEIQERLSKGIENRNVIDDFRVF